MQIDVRHVRLGWLNLLRVTVRHHAGQDTDCLTGGRMMLENQTHRAQFEQKMLFVVKQCIASDRTIGKCSDNRQDKALFVADVTVKV